MKLALVLVVLVVASCGGKSSPPPAEPVKEAEPEPEADGYGYEGEPIGPEAPGEKEGWEEPSRPAVLVAIDPAELQKIGTGEVACDELIWRTQCMWDKQGSAVSDEMRKMFEDGIAAWKMAMQNDATRQATADACKMSLDASGYGFEAVGC